jgi:hypothetical protein
MAGAKDVGRLLEQYGLDPGSRSYVIVLSNRTYPDGRGDALPLRRAILSQVSAALGS